MMTEESKHPKLPKDEFGRGETYHWLVLITVPLLIAALAFLLTQKGEGKDKLVVYCAQDMIYAEPVFKDFETKFGVAVAAVYDSEAVKTVGLANRLLAEMKRPRCDVFWGNEELRTRQLASRGVFLETNGWTAFGYRSRRIVINTNKLSISDAPRSLMDLTNSSWRGRVAFAYPQFGTTATHFHALRQHWGHGQWSAWCNAMAANKPFIMEGNSSVVQIVSKGLADVGLTDSDDIALAQGKGAPIAALPLTQESLLIPNTVAKVKRDRVSPLAEALSKHLREPATVRLLISHGALEGAECSETGVQTLQPDWDALIRDLDQTSAELSTYFLR